MPRSAYALGPPAAKPNPAPFNDEVLRVIQRQLRGYRRGLDPFAGTGKGVDYLADAGHSVVGVELEYEWACQSDLVEVGNALSLRWRANTFDFVFTSPTYANRMADHHDAQERCKPCKGTGEVCEDMGLAGLRFSKCEKCGGEGRRVYKRHTYKHYLGRNPSPDSSCTMQWGIDYCDFHQRAWKEMARVLKPRVEGKKQGRFVLNISDHYRKGALQPVTDFHVETIKSLGFKVVRAIEIDTQRMRHGENYELRADFESVIVFDKVA
jgi:SAM-dependent methyltransferase